jgi:hypothetical protein
MLPCLCHQAASYSSNSWQLARKTLAFEHIVASVHAVDSAASNFDRSLISLLTNHDESGANHCFLSVPVCRSGLTGGSPATMNASPLQTAIRHGRTAASQMYAFVRAGLVTILGRPAAPIKLSELVPVLSRQLSHLGEWSATHSTEPHGSHRSASLCGPGASYKPRSSSRSTRARRLTHATDGKMYEVRHRAMDSNGQAMMSSRSSLK